MQKPRYKSISEVFLFFSHIKRANKSTKKTLPIGKHSAYSNSIAAAP